MHWSMSTLCGLSHLRLTIGEVRTLSNEKPLLSYFREIQSTNDTKSTTNDVYAPFIYRVRGRQTTGGNPFRLYAVSKWFYA